MADPGHDGAELMRERVVTHHPVGTEVRVETMPGGVRVTIIEPTPAPSRKNRIDARMGRRA